jgi:hypothetical protein
MTSLVPVDFDEKSSRQQKLYEAVTEYVREGYKRAISQRKNHIGFLMLLMQRLVASSTSAIARALEKRLEAISSPGDQIMLPLDLDRFSFAEFEELNSTEEITFSGLSGSNRSSARQKGSAIFSGWRRLSSLRRATLRLCGCWRLFRRPEERK